MALSIEQLLTLNTLMYMVDDPFPQVLDAKGKTVGQLIAAVDPDGILPQKEYDCFITGQEWLLLLNTLQQDSTLCSMYIADTHIDQGKGGGGGHSAVFISPQLSEAVVVFKGTQSPEEWADNFAGVNLSDTPQQHNALSWYQQAYQQFSLSSYYITVTGHSKGGNKSKYVSILDPTVDRCVSFDGQGFSQSFTEKYPSLILKRQNIIENHNAEYDFVNFLFNCIGTSFFYTASPLENSGFGRNHSPSAMMHFLPGGGFRMVRAPQGQAPGIRAISEFSDDFFSSLTPAQRESSYQTVEAIRSAAFSIDQTQKGKNLINVFLPLASDPAHTDDLAYLLAYTIQYERCNPAFIQDLRGLLVHFGFEDFTRYILLVDSILNLNLDTPLGILTFDSILDDLSHGAQNISPGLVAILIGWTTHQGIELSPSQLRELLAMLPMVKGYMDTMVMPGGCQSRSAHMGGSRGDGLYRISRSLELIGSVMGGSTPGSHQESSSKLRRTGSKLRTIGHVAGQLSSVFQQFQPEVSSPPQEENPDMIDI